MCCCPGKIWDVHQAEEESHLMHYKQYMWMLGCLLQRTARDNNNLIIFFFFEETHNKKI